MMEKILKINSLIYAIFLTIFLIISKLILNLFNIEYMDIVYYFLFDLIYIFIIVGINQLISKIKKKCVKNILKIDLVCIVIILTFFISMIQIGQYRDIYIAEFNNDKIFVIRPFDCHERYYEYVNLFMRSKNTIEKEINYEIYEEYKKDSIVYNIYKGYIDTLSIIVFGTIRILV